MPFNNVSDPELIAKSAAMVEVFTPEKYAYLLSLFPTPAGFAELHNRLQTNYPAVLQGDPEKAKAFEADRKALNCDLNLILGLAKAAAVKDATVPESLGLGRQTEKAAPATVSLTTPHDFRVFFDSNGHLFVSVIKVPGAKGYQVWACDGDPSNEANWKLVASSANCRKIPILGLNRGKFNLLKIRAIRGNSAGPWSNWVSLDPT